MSKLIGQVSGMASAAVNSVAKKAADLFILPNFSAMTVGLYKVQLQGGKVVKEVLHEEAAVPVEGGTNALEDLKMLVDASRKPEGDDVRFYVTFDGCEDPMFNAMNWVELLQEFMPNLPDSVLEDLEPMNGTWRWAKSAHGLKFSPHVTLSIDDRLAAFYLAKEEVAAKRSGLTVNTTRWARFAKARQRN